MSWTPEKVGKLKKLWGNGNTASQIANIIGDVTRNAVIGKAHRLNLATKSVPRNVTIKQNQQNLVTNSLNGRKTRKSKFKSLFRCASSIEIQSNIELSNNSEISLYEFKGALG